MAGFTLAMTPFPGCGKCGRNGRSSYSEDDSRECTPSELYEFWTNPENYPKVFAHVNQVTRERNGLFRWQFNLQFEEKANAPEAGNGEVSNKEVLNKKEAESRL